MYHKKPDKQIKSLSEWVNEKNSQKTTKISGFWHLSDYRPPTEDIEESIIKLEEEKEPAVMKTQELEVPSFEKHEQMMTNEDVKRLHKKGESEMNKEQLISKLKQEQLEYKDKILAIDNKAINSISISETQQHLLIAQRNALMTLVSILDMRIGDLSVEVD